jgi:hypothetical protein
VRFVARNEGANECTIVFDRQDQSKVSVRVILEADQFADAGVPEDLKLFAAVYRHV